MFSLKLTDAQASLDKQIRALALERIRPCGLAAERERTIPAELAAELDAIGRHIRQSTELRDPMSSVVALEAVAFGDPGIAYALLPAFQLAHIVDACGSAQQQERVRSASAAIWSTPSAVMLYEGYGRGPTEMQTTATRIGDDWAIDGRKIAVHHPGAAEVSVLIATTADELVGFVLDGTPKGLEVENDTWRTGVLGGGVAPTGALRLSDVVCTDEQRLGGSSRDLHRAVAYARLMLAAVQVGAAAAAVDHAGGWAKERQAFGKTLSSFQGVAFTLVEADTKTDAARLELWDAVHQVGSMSDPAKLDRVAGRAVRCACDTSTWVTREGIQLLGVHGIVTEHPVERFWRHASTLSLIDFDPLATPLSLT